MNNTFSSNHNEVNTGHGVKCHFVLFSCVLCIVLTKPPNHWTALKEKKKKDKRESLTLCTYFFVDQSHTWKTYNPTKWNTYPVLVLVLLIGKLTHYTVTVIRFFLLLVFVPSKVLNKLLIYLSITNCD